MTPSRDELLSFAAWHRREASLARWEHDRVEHLRQAEAHEEAARRRS